MRRVGVIAGMMVAISACAGSGLVVTEARVGEPTGPNAALYFTASGGDDRLVGATTSVATAVEAHETSMGDDGTMTMRPVADLAVSVDSDLVLEPGGFHLMLIDVDRLEVGDTIEVALRWETAGDMTIEALVVSPADTAGDR